MKSNRITSEVKEHWNKVAALGSIISNSPAELCHCHDGSITEELDPKYHPGIAERQNHYLVIPLSMEEHRGWHGLDTSDVDGWEGRHGRQTELLEEVSYRLGYCVFERAGITDYEYKNKYFAMGASTGSAFAKSSDSDALGEESEI